MTRRSSAHVVGISLAVLVALTSVGRSTNDTTDNATEPSVSDASLTGIAFDVHRDPG